MDVPAEMSSNEIISSNIKMADTQQSTSEETRLKRAEELYWTLTDRERYMNKGKEQLKAENFHMWGKINNIKENSKSLNHLVKNGIERVLNFKDTLLEIYTELGYKYRIKDIPTRKPTLVGVSIDVEYIFPPLTFIGTGYTITEAEEAAAKLGLRYLVDLA